MYYGYSFGTAAWSLAQAALLAASPTTIVTILGSDVRPPSELEIYLSRALALTLTAFGCMTVLLTGSIPLTSSLAATTSESDPKAPYTVPVLSISMAYHAAAAFLCYSAFTKGSSKAFALAALVSGILAATALWTLLFATVNGRISRKTLITDDHRTSGFPFKNVEADKARAERKQR